MNLQNAMIAGCSLMLILMATVSLTNAQPFVSEGRLAAKHLTKVERFLNGRIPVGFYIYTYAWKQNSDPQAHDLDDAIAEMAKDGLNYLYVGGTGDTPIWSRLLELCHKYRIAVVPQLNFAYLRNGITDVDALVARAVPFIKKYKDHPAVMAFSVREEPSLSMMPILKRYYEGIRREVPDAPLHLLHNYLPPALATQPPYPLIMGADRYGFWWEMSGHRATPAYALEWYHTQLALYYQLTALTGAEFQAVFTATAWAIIISPETLKKNFYGPGANAPDGREKYYRMVKELADKENQGWAKVQGENLRYWYYYRPPVNSVRAMSWLSIMEGARSIAIWPWSPPSTLNSKVKNFEELSHAKPGKFYWSHINGRKGPAAAQYAEYVEFASEVQRYAKLIRAMTKECPPLPSQFPLGHEPAVNTNGAKAILSIEGDDVAWQAFSVPGYSGKVVVAVNTAVGSWCDGRSPKYLSRQDIFRIDDKGELVDYVPFTKPRELSWRVLLNDMACFDLQTGKAVNLNKDQTMTLPIAPGKGRLIFLAPKGSDQWERFRREFQL